MTRRDLLKSGIAVSTSAALYSNDGEPIAPEGSTLPRERLLLDSGWRFSPGHASDPSRDFGFAGGKGETFAKSGDLFLPSDIKYDDSDWKKVDLPHDWAVELPFENDKDLYSHGCKPLGRKYPASSIGWYRRVFDIPVADAGRRIALEFDGVFRDCIVALNGHYLGRNLSGYAPFRFDVSDFLNYGDRNVLVVRVDASINEGWFYEGAGIYRHVWLTKTSPVHVAHWGTFVRAEVTGSGATVRVTTEVENEGDDERTCQVVSAVVDGEGRAVATVRSAPAPVKPWGRLGFEQEIAVGNPALWSPDAPNLYRLLTTVESPGAVVDRYETPFGIRTLRFDANDGFFLNGQRVEIKGTCNHQDHAGVGAALPDRIQYYRIERLKEMGSNALRTSHNPPTPELLDACDRLGMLVMDETRMMSSNHEGLSELERLIRRDRNHPCVVLWSLGNEEPEQGTERGARMMTSMKRLARKLDPTRPVTAAMNFAGWTGAAPLMDVRGFNYSEKGIDAYHKQLPNQPMVGSETASTVSTRGIYATDKERGYVSAYDVNFPRWAATAEKWWSVYAERPFLAGGFVWTGFDYRGEPTPYGWPCINSHFGIMDTCGFAKDNFYYYQAWWGSKPVLHLFPHWNWKEGEEIAVWCHTNLERVELFLNGRSLGARDVMKNSHLEWTVQYEPGVIEARGYRGGQQVLTAKRETTGAPARIVLRPDRTRIAADGEDVSMVAAEIVDSQGRIVSAADNEIAFSVEGNGRLIGVGNGDPSSHESDKGNRRRAFNGLCMAIVQGSKQDGALKITASSPGLEGASVTLECAPARPRPSA
ncbi:MAG: beta-galactosidase GalA [Bryobacteraceae bacterium]